MTEEKEIFHRHIQHAGLKRTAQRDRILDVFLRTEKHLSSEDLYQLVKEEDPSVGHTTVYRTLKLLVEAGPARPGRFRDGPPRSTSNSNNPHPRHNTCTAPRKTPEFTSTAASALHAAIVARPSGRT